MFDGAKRLAGMLITLTPTVLTLFGFETSPDFTGDATEIVSGVFTVVGVLVTLYGIIKAKAPMWFQKKA